MSAAPLLSFGVYDLERMGPEPLFKLYETVYGDAASLRQRWRWELLERPDHGELKIHVAWHEDELVAMTVRIPCPLVVAGAARRAFFASHTMVDPAYRGQGVIASLYARAQRDTELQLSKGTAPGMYRVLLKMGYREVVPSNYLVCLLAPLRWGAGKLFPNLLPPVRESFGALREGEFSRISRFTEEHATLVHAGIDGGKGGVVKSVAFLNWRYFDVPHRKYHVLVRKIEGATVAMAVVRLAGTTATLVDLRWGGQVADEPAASIRFAKSFARKAGAVKLVSWGTSRVLRQALRRQLFFDRGETPRFSFYPADASLSEVDWTQMHLVHGDGDTEYL